MPILPMGAGRRNLPGNAEKTGGDGLKNWGKSYTQLLRVF